MTILRKRGTHIRSGQMFVIAAVRPPLLESKSTSHPKKKAKRDRPTPPSLETPFHYSSAASSSSSGGQSRTKASEYQTDTRIVNRITSNIDQQKRNGPVPPSGVGADAPCAELSKAEASRPDLDRNTGVAIQRSESADDTEPSVGNTDKRATSNTEYLYRPDGESWIDDDPDWIPPPVSWPVTPVGVSPESQVQSVPTSPPTSYHIETDEVGETDASCLESAIGVAGETPSRVTVEQGRPSMLPSRRSLTEILADLPPDQRPPAFYPRSQLQQQYCHVARRDLQTQIDLLDFRTCARLGVQSHLPRDSRPLISTPSGASLL